MTHPAIRRTVGLEHKAEWVQATEAYKAPFFHREAFVRLITGGPAGVSGPVRLLSTGNERQFIGAVPVCVRYFRGHGDLYTPYGCQAVVTPGQESAFIDALTDFAMEQMIVAAYIGVRNEDTVRTFPPSYEPAQAFHLLPLAPPLDQIWASIRSNIRGSINAVAAEPALEIRVAAPKADDLEVAAFADLYHAFLERTRPAAVYWLDRATLTALCRQDGAHFIGAHRGGDLVAGSLFVSDGRTMTYLFNAAAHEYRMTSAAIIWHAIQLAKESNHVMFDLGGGVAAGDSLTWFKSRFGGVAVPQRVLRLVFDRQVFADLTLASGTGQVDYFPPYQYRSPRASSTSS